MGQDTQVEKEDDRPKWLLELENRKRKPRLAHEVGAGSPCIKCNSDCPGLDLHFWRKICKNCKCGRDDHDVPDDEFPQFDLLFGPSGKPKRRAIVLKINKQQVDNEETFEWAPPDTTKELAADYMKALPQDKLPIKGSIGAALRKQQLQKQLPLHDIDHKVCDELSESERKQFEKYLENIKNYVGQGKVSKIVTAKPFEKSLITPANASECFTPNHKINVINSQPPNLRTPSSFVPKSIKMQLKPSFTSQEETLNVNPNHNLNRSVNSSNSLLNNDSQATPSQLNDIPSSLLGQKMNNKLKNDTQAIQSRLDKVKSPIMDKALSDSSKLEPGRYHHLLENIKNGEKMAESNLLPCDYNAAINFANIKKLSPEEKYSTADQYNNGVTRKDFANSSSNFGPKNFNNSPLQGSSKNSEQNGCYSNREITPKVPEYLVSVNSVPSNKYNPLLNLVKSNLNTSNKLNNDSNSLPYQSAHQKIENPRSELAKIDSGPLKSHCWAKKWNQLSDESNINSDRDENSILASKMLSDALLPPSSIHSSDIIGSTLDQKGLSFIREKLASKYNPTDGPVDQNNLLKSRELKQENQKPLSKLINQGFNTNSINQNNSKPVQAHFSSYKTPENSTINSENLKYPVFPEEAVGTTRIVEDPNVNRLGGAMNNLSMNQNNHKVQKCHQCQEGIFVGDVVVTAEKAKDAAWHPGCFVCFECNELLVDLVYFYYKGKLYCARDLANLLGIPRCFACDELIFVREYTVAEGHNYHVKHFCCWDCDMPLAGQQYISENDRPLCFLCYQKTYAKTCYSCQKLIEADQQELNVKDLTFHASDKCFCCASCSKSLLNGRMTIKENKLFCSKECVTMYVNQSRS
ncbi:Wilms tumor protein 1-interacting protein homolog [Chelonus insularis]|uniref:Wilms tumor protein 1-interacting protein homolog n=1 Tax=Chelonus insularis TaxID=460826 RepID=UPI00158E19C1|nr:Wilms tumor protein 1-interacting protein homolog [Chelonus insularis]